MSDKTIRNERKWVKVTRLGSHGRWFFSMGFDGETKAYKHSNYELAVFTWETAMERAREMLTE